MFIASKSSGPEEKEEKEEVPPQTLRHTQIADDRWFSYLHPSIYAFVLLYVIYS